MTDAGSPSGPERVEVGLQIDVFGRFNPAIFRPSWLAAEKLMRQEELESAEDEEQGDDFFFLRTKDVAVEVTLRRFRLFSLNQALDLTHRDLVVNIFTLLRHTPVQLLRVTRFVHLAGDMEDRGRLWARFVDPQPFSALLKDATPGQLTLRGAAEHPHEDVEISMEASDVDGASLFVSCTYERNLAERRAGENPLDALEVGWEEQLSHSETVFASVGSIMQGGSS